MANAEALATACNAALELRRHRRRLNPAEPVTLRELLGMHRSRTPAEPERKTDGDPNSGQLAGNSDHGAQEDIDLDQLDPISDSASVQASNALRWALTNQQFPLSVERPDNCLQDHAPMTNFAVYSGQDA